ncbi:hypothetical protein Tco_1577508 [Tanacetum coccineum]
MLIAKLSHVKIWMENKEGKQVKNPVSKMWKDWKHSDEKSGMEQGYMVLTLSNGNAVGLGPGGQPSSPNPIIKPRPELAVILNGDLIGEDVIVIDDVDVPNELAKTDNNAEVKEEHVTIDVPNQHDVVDDEVLLTPIKRSKKNHIKISARNRLYRVFDEEEDEDEAENKNPWEVDDGVSDEDEVDDENEVDDEDDWN